MESAKSLYKELGTKAWTERGIPFYLTNNPKIAQQYADTTLAYFQDCLQTQASKEERQTFYIFDLGSGIGRFAYLFLKYLTQAIKCLKLQVNIRYILMEPSQRNLDFYQTHPYLKAYFNAGILDCCLFQIDLPKEHFLQYSKQILKLDEIQAPSVVIANALFESIYQEHFRIEKGEIQRGLISLYYPKSHHFKNLPDLSKLSLQCRFEPIQSPKQWEETFMEILEDYQKCFDHFHFLIPKGACALWEQLQIRLPKGFLLLSTDRGHSEKKQLERNMPPSFEIHKNLFFP